MNSQNPKSTTRRAVLVGGGNSGAQLLPHLARMSSLKNLITVDFDRYEVANLANQEISPSQVGKLKCDVLAEKAISISSDLNVQSICARIEDVPRGLLRDSILIACTDSRASRLAINTIACRWGTTMIDTAIGIHDRLVTVAIFRANRSAPCMECTWCQNDYDALEQKHVCNSSSRQPKASAPSFLGALAASVASVEIDKILTDRIDESLLSCRRLIGTRTNEHSVMRLVRNPECRFDHQVWQVEQVTANPEKTSFAQLLDRCGADVHDPKNATICIEGQRFAHFVTCNRCQSREQKLLLTRALRNEMLVCSTCSEPLSATALDSSDKLRFSALSYDDQEAPLVKFGILPHEVISIRSEENVSHIEIIEGPKNE